MARVRCPSCGCIDHSWLEGLRCSRCAPHVEDARDERSEPLRGSGVAVKFRRLSPRATLPHYATPGSAVLDLSMAAESPLILWPGDVKIVPTGWAVEIPPGYEGQVRPRSGLAAKHSITVLNAPGTIDSDYRGEVCVLLVNLGNRDYTIQPGDRIAQLVIAPVSRVAIEEAGELAASERGAAGFGSTGR